MNNPVHPKASPLPAFVAVTLDVDPDANRAAEGRSDCVSTGFRGRISVRALRSGLDLLKDMLLSLDVPATIFWEARSLNILSRSDPHMINVLADHPAFEHACHGMRHEDYTHLSATMMEENIRQATHIIELLIGRTPIGFRAPFCARDSRVVNVLSDCGYRYDASLTRDVYGDGKRATPFLPEQDGRIHPAFRILPMIRWRDDRGRPISGYLWQILEGRRCPHDYLRMIREIGALYPGQLVQLAVHPWHIMVRENGVPVAAPEDSVSSVNAILGALSNDQNVCLTTLESYMTLFLSGAIRHGDE